MAFFKQTVRWQCLPHYFIFLVFGALIPPCLSSVNETVIEDGSMNSTEYYLSSVIETSEVFYTSMKTLDPSLATEAIPTSQVSLASLMLSVTNGNSTAFTLTSSSFNGHTNIVHANSLSTEILDSKTINKFTGTLPVYNSLQTSSNVLYNSLSPRVVSTQVNSELTETFFQTLTTLGTLISAEDISASSVVFETPSSPVLIKQFIPSLHISFELSPSSSSMSAIDEFVVGTSNVFNTRAITESYLSSSPDLHELSPSTKLFQTEVITEVVSSNFLETLLPQSLDPLEPSPSTTLTLATDELIIVTSEIYKIEVITKVDIFETLPPPSELLELSLSTTLMSATDGFIIVTSKIFETELVTEVSSDGFETLPLSPDLHELSPSTTLRSATDEFIFVTSEIFESEFTTKLVSSNVLETYLLSSLGSLKLSPSMTLMSATDEINIVTSEVFQTEFITEVKSSDIFETLLLPTSDLLGLSPSSTLMSASDTLIVTSEIFEMEVITEVVSSVILETYLLSSTDQLNIVTPEIFETELITEIVSSDVLETLIIPSSDLLGLSPSTTMMSGTDGFNIVTSEVFGTEFITEMISSDIFETLLLPSSDLLGLSSSSTLMSATDELNIVTSEIFETEVITER
ncbi:chitinase-like protein PB1E7.04c [Anneissia japonica]|uniref:chitinase-like protein PB1E7.04c n=1 Tax=Anneissia japonica TaxID=1529436 RepID=UPI0014257005|nr:chitinase-like protein PB1E7.04c [Anneissia japonica]